MKFLPSTIALLFFVFPTLWSPGKARCEDMRELRVQASQAKKALLEKAAAEKKAALEEAESSRRKILQDRAALRKAVEELEEQNRRLETDIEGMEAESEELTKREEELSGKLAETDGVMRELAGSIRVSAKDIHALIEQNPQAALKDDRTDFLEAIAEKTLFPGMADLEKMVAILDEEIRGSGQVRLIRGDVIDRSGNAKETEILVLGNFTMAYRDGEEIGFLTHSSAGQKLFALSQPPSGRIQKRIRKYMDAESEAVPIDISRGGALRQLTHRSSLLDQISKGGPIVWPILAILALGLGIVLERIIFLSRKRLDADNFASRVERLFAERKWEECKNFCGRYAEKPVARVMAAGLACCHMTREAMEDALQEAILKEAPPLERFLSTLGMLAAIAPLLGLLGTVTGMIDTFHVITRHGTGDPRMMSGGISEALVTTMLGLSVAIPIMLAHTLLNRAVDTRIGQMEEKAMALVNIVHKSREGENGNRKRGDAETRHTVDAKIQGLRENEGAELRFQRRK